MAFFWENNAIIILEHHALVIVFILYLEIISTPLIATQRTMEKLTLCVAKWPQLCQYFLIFKPCFRLQIDKAWEFGGQGSPN
jgi:hypothetical protein